MWWWSISLFIHVYNETNGLGKHRTNRFFYKNTNLRQSKIDIRGFDLSVSKDLLKQSR